MWTNDNLKRLAQYVQCQALYRVTVAGHPGTVVAVAFGNGEDQRATFATDESKGEPVGFVSDYLPIHFVVSELKPLHRWWRAST